MESSLGLVLLWLFLGYTGIRLSLIPIAMEGEELTMYQRILLYLFGFLLAPLTFMWGVFAFMAIVIPHWIESNESSLAKWLRKRN